MADVLTTFSTLSSDAPNVYIARQMYRLAEKQLIVGRYAKMHQMPQRMGKTLRIVRYKRLTLPFSTLTEGVPPDAVALSTENVDVTVEQWGIVALLTDVVQITTTHPALQIAIDRTSTAIAEVLERETCETLMGGSQVYYPGTATSRATITATDKLSTAVVLKASVALRALGAAAGAGGVFNGVMSPQSEGDILSSDQTFKDASNFANVRALQFGEIGIWMAVRWGRGNFLPIIKGVPAPTTAAATAEKTQATGATSDVDTSVITVVARDILTDFERKVSGEFTLADEDDIVFPSSTNYVYDLYMTAAGGANYKLLASRQVAGSTFQVTAAKYTAASLATPPAAPANQVEVFVSWIFGQEAFGRVELNGMSLASYLTPAGASYSNPLAQGRKVGTKVMWKCFIIDNNFFARIESASGYSAQLAA